MFLDHYQLGEQPFSAVSDVQQIYASGSHSEAIAWARTSILSERGGLALIGEPGIGKTTLLRQLLENFRESGRATFLFDSQCAPREILQAILTELGVDISDLDPAAMFVRLNAIWFAEMLAGKRFVLLFDDAHQLRDSALDALCQLAKYETSNTRFLQMVLCGGTQLNTVLQRAKFAPLCKHVSQTRSLEPLSTVESAGYVRHRLFTAGYRGPSLFDPEALAAIAHLSGGVPQDINKICSRALFEAYARGHQTITAEIIEKAARNVSVAPVSDAPASTGVAPASLAEANLGATVDAKVLAQLTYATPKQFGFPGSGVWAGVIVGALLSAGLALPHGILKGVTHIMRGSPTTAVGALTSIPNPQVLVPSESSMAPLTSQAISTNSASSKEQLSPIPTQTYRKPTGQFSLTRELGLKINRIVIDPGHGGFDTGAKGPSGLLEKDLCLDVALRLGQLIESNIPSAEVIFTRKTDTYVPLEERTAIANRADADLFISIHANSSGSAEVRGVETYYLSLATSREAKELAIRENALTQSSLHDLPDLVQKITRNEKVAESKLLAAQIQDLLSQRLQLVSRREKDRGVKQAPFIVLTGANMPAVLSEISFLSNATDENLLLETGQRQRIADGLYRGITAYLDGLHGTPPVRQKLITENRAEPSSNLASSVVQPGRRPL